jgi:hypothetical protein
MDFLPLAPLPDLDDLPPPLPAVSDAEIGTARGYVEAARAAGTRRAYATDWRRFAKWCRERGAPALPAAPALVAVHLSSLAERGWRRHRSAARWPRSPIPTNGPG